MATNVWVGMDALSILDLYDQTEFWIDQQGKRHKLTEMDDRYLANVRRFIKRNGRGHLTGATLSLWAGPVDWYDTNPLYTALYQAVVAELERRHG